MAQFRRNASLEWTGDVVRGTGHVVAGSGAFRIAATFPRLGGEPDGATTPEELLAAAHAACFGIGLRSILGQRGATAARIRVTATLTAEKAAGRISLVSAHLQATIEGAAGLEQEALDDAAKAAEQACTISEVLRRSVPITVAVLPEPPSR